MEFADSHQWVFVHCLRGELSSLLQSEEGEIESTKELLDFFDVLAVLVDVSIACMNLY
jgi:hypothetical protein